MVRMHVPEGRMRIRSVCNVDHCDFVASLCAADASLFKRFAGLPPAEPPSYSCSLRSC